MIYIQHSLRLLDYKKIIFIDRDGVINEDSAYYIRSKSLIKIKKSTEKALKMLKENDIGVIIVTNQQMIGKKLVSMGEAIDIHMEILHKINYEKYSIIGSCICPHLESDHCRCRKPSCGMAEFTKKIFGIDISNTYIIGDRETDINFAANCGMHCLYLGDVSVEYLKCHKFDDLYHAVLWLIDILTNKKN